MFADSASQDETKNKIRSHARQLMCEKGIENVTIREIAAAAGANVAAINYHFRSKENLTYEVLRDVARRSAHYRIEILEEIEGRAAQEGREVTIAEIVRCFLSGYMRKDNIEEGVLLTRLILKNRMEPTEWTSTILNEELEWMAVRFIDALARAAPHLSVKDIGWRYHFMIGTVVIALNNRSNPGRMRRLTGGACDTEDTAELRRQLEAQMIRTFA